MVFEAALMLRCNVNRPVLCAFGKCAALLAIASSPLFAQQLLTETSVRLRRGPDTTTASIRTLAALTRVTPIEGDTVRGPSGMGFVHVRTSQGQEGFIAADLLFVERPSIIVHPDTVIGLSAPVREVDPMWDKPPIGKSILVHSDSARKKCGPRGNDTDPKTFILKNRSDSPNASHAVNFDALIDLPFDQGMDADGLKVPKDRTRWKPAHFSTVSAFEGISLTVTGFLAAVKPQRSGGEATNCGFKGEQNTDWHIALTRGHRDGESHSIVVEPTPRIKRLHENWTVARLRDRTGSERSRSDSVRVTGFLFYDPDHANHLGTFRRSMWELHPVTRIELFVAGRWIDIDDLP